jgi:hypothetical protein
MCGEALLKACAASRSSVTVASERQFMHDVSDRSLESSGSDGTRFLSFH